jgi:hypothetical protein
MSSLEEDMSQDTPRATRRFPLLMLVAPAIALAAGFAVHLLAADGSKGKLLVYDAKVAAEQGDWYFKVELEPILFRLVSLQNKYKVIRVNIVNRSKKPLQLSLQDDRFQIRIGAPGAANAKVVNAVLDIARTDPDWWKSLDPALQRALAYPDQAAIRTSEEENIFVFVPVADLPAFPDQLLFSIKSFSATPIVIERQRVASAA